MYWKKWILPCAAGAALLLGGVCLGAAVQPAAHMERFDGEAEDVTVVSAETAAETAEETFADTFDEKAAALFSPIGIERLLAVGKDEAKQAAEMTAGLTAAPASESAGDQADGGDADGEEENEYANLAIAQVSDYVNVRSEPSTEGTVAGKIYDGSVAEVLGVAGVQKDWFQIISGSVEGYIKAEYFLYGPEAEGALEEHVTRYASILADRLNVRKEPSRESSRIGYVNEGEKILVEEDQGEWLKVVYAGNQTGYIAAEYAQMEESFVYAKSLEEEAAERAAQAALEERAKQSEKQSGENTKINAIPPGMNYTSNQELREAMVDYAMQFLGNRYIHGGQSLENGTDCSGFTCYVYKAFGYGISRTPGGQLASAGRSIDLSELQPGDIVCYTSSSRCDHVGMYIGNGQIIHSANSRKGVIISDVGYSKIVGAKDVLD